jgi:hypothetical protein
MGVVVAASVQLAVVAHGPATLDEALAALTA